MRIWRLVKFFLMIVIIAALAFAGFKLYELIQRKFVLPLKYEVYVEKYAAEYKLPQALIYGVMKTESSFQAGAVSDQGAVGLMQIMPDTYQWLCGLTGEDLDVSKLANPETNIKYGCLFLSQLKNQFGDQTAVLAAYNAGQGTVIKWLSDESVSEGGKLVNIPYPETKAYVEKVQKAAQDYQRLYEQEKEWTSYE